MPDERDRPPAGPFTIRGAVMHTPCLGGLERHQDAALEVAADGAVAALHPAGSEGFAAAVAAAARAGTLLALSPAHTLIPGFVDLHVHAPQWPQAGRALDLPLERWLQQYTFPLESRYADLDFARAVYDDLVGCLLANGTTSAVYFATIHEAPSLELARVCLRAGQRAFVGLVAMDDAAECPDFYRNADAAQAIAATRRHIDGVRDLPGNEAGLVRPIITPRFIPACTDALLHGLGRLAQETGCLVQTHCSESDWEHGFVAARTGRSDTASLDGFGLLRRHSILAHGNLIGDDDMDLIAGSGAAIAHCPISNVFFSDAVFPLHKALQRGLLVGLGTDLAGGYSPSVLDNARQAVLSARLLASGVDPDRDRSMRGQGDAARIGFREAFWLATAGGGDALGLPVGRFTQGSRFDAILLDADAPGSNIRLHPGESDDDRLQALFGATRANMAGVWVDGRRVAGTRA
ncbi:amidohydrolase family protein [Lichenicoccus sp.]|uniref:amidohydrolase family protein n=1 Tax=Lichenicoccus sp. TaxID=2781899 RepID=UPI003D1071FA